MLRVRSATVLAAMALMVTGCSALNGTSPPPAGPNPHGLEKPVVTVAVTPLVNTAPFKLALKNGFFKQQGLTIVEKGTTSGSVSIPKLDKGIDITESNDVTAITAEVSGANDLKFIVDGYLSAPGSHMVLATADSGIKSVHDLQGHTVAVNTLDDIVTRGFQELLTTHAIPLSSVKFVLIPYANMFQAFAQHQIVAAVVGEPYQTQIAQAFGTKPVVDVFSGYTVNIPISSYVATAAFVKAYPKTVAAFQRAMRQGAELAGDRSQVEQILPTYISTVDHNTAALIHLGVFPTDLNAKRLQRDADLMLQLGALKNTFDVSTMIVPMPTP